MAWQFNQREPVFLQIANRLRGDILRGEYDTQVQFPSVRQLAAVASVNPNTMQKALSHLEEEGLLYTRGTVGRFVTDDEKTLEASREKMRRDFAARVIEESVALGMNAQELIKYIKKEVEENERTGTGM